MPTGYYNQRDRIDTEKAIAFVMHIENHLKEMKIDGQVMCKLCGKTIDEIYEEEAED